LAKIRYQLAGYREDLEKYLASLPTGDDGGIRADLPEALLGVIATNRPKTGELLLKWILDPGHPLHRPAVNAFVHSVPHLTAAQIETFVRHVLLMESKARPAYVRGVDATIGMVHYPRYDWNGWLPASQFELRTTTTHYLDGQRYGEPFKYKG